MAAIQTNSYATQLWNYICNGKNNPERTTIHAKVAQKDEGLNKKEEELNKKDEEFKNLLEKCAMLTQANKVLVPIKM